MKAFALFLFSLFFFLLCGCNYIYASVDQKATCYLPAQNLQKARQIQFGNANQSSPIVKNNGLSEKKEDFISLEDEDDDVSFTRKYVLVAKSFVSLAYASISVHLHYHLKSRLPFCRHLSYTSSYKYILQRVLRI